MPLCPECQRELDGDELICPHCLARLAPPAEPADRPEEQPGWPPARGVRLTPVELAGLDEPGDAGGEEPSPVLAAGSPREPLFRDEGAVDTLVSERSSLIGHWRKRQKGERAVRAWETPVTVTLPGRLGRLRGLFALAAALALVALGVGLGRLYWGGDAAGPAVDAFEVGQELFDQERYQAAQFAFGQAVAEEMQHPTPRLAAALNMMGWSAYHAGEHAEAMALFGSALGVNSELVEAQVGMGLAALALGDAEEAEAWLQGARDLAPDEPALHRALGELYLEQGRPDLALFSLERALESAPDEAEVQRMLGLALFEAGDYERAVDLLEKGLAGQPEPAALQALVDGLVALGRYDQAVEAAGRLLEMDPASLAYQYVYGLTLLRAGRPDQAIPALTEVVQSERAGLLADALRQLGLALSHKERYQEALAPLDASLALRPDEPATLELKGWALARIGRCADALPLFEKALDLAPGQTGAAEGRKACRQWLGLE